MDKPIIMLFLPVGLHTVGTDAAIIFGVHWANKLRADVMLGMYNHPLQLPSVRGKPSPSDRKLLRTGVVISEHWSM